MIFIVHILFIHILSIYSINQRMSCYDAMNKNGQTVGPNKKTFENGPETASFWQFIGLELTRSYALDYDEDQYSAREQKVKSFFGIPWHVEKFMAYGCLQCADSFLFVYSFLPLRVLLTLFKIPYRLFSNIFGCKCKERLVNAAEICDLLKISIIIICSFIMSYVDIAVVYHSIKSQSIIKLYIFYNMLEILDKLLSTFGQDSIDTLFWTATDSQRPTKNNIGFILMHLLSIIYVSFHSFLVLGQATILNVAINSSSSALITIMISNNFVEIKASVFKKFDKSNWYQVSCSDVRERFHLLILLSIVVLLTMKEYAWTGDMFWSLMGYCAAVLGSEMLIDWVKHAFVTRFNELSLDIYKDYLYSLAYDVAQTRQKNACTDHSDLVARRMGFIPLPLGVVVIHVLRYVIRIDDCASILLSVLGYFCLLTTRIWIHIYILGKACDLIRQHQVEKLNVVFDETPVLIKRSRPVSMDPITTSIYPSARSKANNNATKCLKFQNNIDKIIEDHSNDINSTALFTNSNVNITDICLNEEVIGEDEVANENKKLESIGECENEIFTRSEPNIIIQTTTETDPEVNEINASLHNLNLSDDNLSSKKRAESEPSLPSVLPQ